MSTKQQHLSFLGKLQKLRKIDSDVYQDIAMSIKSIAIL